ncbi:excinuclease ABC subunit UvrB [Candidatus Parcubacteria bacterium]|jgi:excinuclease ABC subunit B|nr:MAG: excinuclease ABC subunit UvrB [Candidatus Parcubacteria bacterium]
MNFKLRALFKPTGDQPQAIEKLVKGLKSGYTGQTLLGVTGSGKTFTMAKVIAEAQRPTLIISHNKTLAAQLASEFEEFFPQNAVHYFVSYYDYYQPEAYIPKTDTYIEKETDINEEIDRLRHASTQAILSRRDVIIVASVSCIYGLGSPAEYQKGVLALKKSQTLKRQALLNKLIAMQFERRNLDIWRGSFRVLGEVVEIFPSFSEDRLYKIYFFGDEIEKIEEVDALTGKNASKLESVDIYPATQYVTDPGGMELALAKIEKDLKERLAWFKANDKLLEAERLKQRINFDLEMLRTAGFVSGIENYSRYFDGRQPGTPPYTLMDFFPKDYLLFIDESHMTVPQIGGMYEGDKARKKTLIDYGFRLPAAYDNRPLKFTEFEKRINQVIFVSATPREYEKAHSQSGKAGSGSAGQIVEQLIRPTGLLDPKIEVKPTKNQVDDLLEQIRKRVEKGQRVLVTTLTKRIAEDLTEYLKDLDIKVEYLHSDVETFDRLEILRTLRTGEIDVVVGINLLREGLDLPEVSLVAILDADKEGYLRSDTALIQTMGRAARHVEGSVIMYADRVTKSMQTAISETLRRRKIQKAYNQKHNITPKTIIKAIRESRLAGKKSEEEKIIFNPQKVPKEEIPYVLKDLENQMSLAAQNLEFEKAANIRDQIRLLKPEEANRRRPRRKKFKR